MYKKKEFKKLTSLYDVHVYTGINGIAIRYCHKKLECFKGKEKYNNVLEIGAGTTPHIDYIKHKFDNYYIAETSEASIKHYENYKYDIRNFDAIEPLFKGVDYIFHLAAEARIQPAIEDPTTAVEINVVGTCNILQAARIHKIKRVIYSSTSAAYGLKNPIPLKETMPKDCLNPYSVF